MEISIPRFLSSIPNGSSLIPNPSFRHSTSTVFPKSYPTLLKKPGLIHLLSPLPRASTSEETEISISNSNQLNKLPNEAIRTNFCFERAPDEAIRTDNESEKAPDEAIKVGEQSEKTPDEARSINAQFDKPLDEAIHAELQLDMEPDGPIKTGAVYDEVKTTEETSVETSVVAQTKALELLDGLNIKLNYSDSFSILIYGSGALVAIWIFSAIVGAIDSTPFVSEVLELIGLAYTVWFSYHYLIFKKSREELSVKIEELKKQIIGSTDD